MALPSLVENWRIKITGIAKSTSQLELSELLNINISRIYIPKIKDNESPYAWIDGFTDQQEAHEFANSCSNVSIGNNIIKCTVAEPRSRGSIKPKFDKGGEEGLTIKLILRPNSRTRNQNTHESSTIYPRSSLQNTKNPPKTIIQSNTPDRGNVLPLCRYAKNGKCRKKSSECEYRHVKCHHFDSCANPQCSFAHSRMDRTESSFVPPFDDGVDKLEATSNLHKSDSISSLFSIASSMTEDVNHRPCLNGIKCYKFECKYDHPNGWNPCSDGVKCDDYECSAEHPPKRRQKCERKERCKNTKCNRLHPSIRPRVCRSKGKCRQWNCRMLHPPSRLKLCKDKENCDNDACPCLHPPGFTRPLCFIGVECRDISCKLKHPVGRPPICEQGDSCTNFNCTRLHSSEWNPCDAGTNCVDQNCSKIHPEGREIMFQDIKQAVTSNNKKRSPTKREILLKSKEQRDIERQKAKLPILSCRGEFLQRLENERVLVVTAETGSGKSTQLPQYAAEHFGSLVICTQPRVVATVSLARRVAEEYDGKSVGESVGYQTGSGNRVRGSHIMFMTDAALIRESQCDPSLKHVKVLIVDEAHERSLNTDVVIGISKILLAQRPNDFYVVIASATIDPSSFLKFFDRPINSPLDVKGRLFPVKVDNKPPPNKNGDPNTIEAHVVSTVIQLYGRHQGHTLVFLPGQGEIERTLKKCKTKLPDNCIPLPLYGSQSPEDQEKVINFDDKSKRMVVFCTNVAETSITIPNVQLVIDSGWAKEARYDVQRRVTIIETVRISRSSADQRKGRAGRTVAGHCVRLYDDNELKRPNIEPEILRSSLDLILLQLIRLNLRPQSFPFMDQPKIDNINRSLELLTTLQCIENGQITKRGELFSELTLDPRFSAFIVDIYKECKTMLDVAVSLVAILSAPGTIFFMGGTNQEDRDRAKARVALEANKQKSDLIYLYSVYKGWKQSGSNETKGRCAGCQKPVRYCICRIKYSNEHGLNNKILQYVDNACTTIIKQIEKTSWLKSNETMVIDLNDVIGRKLAELFPEQCGHLLVPSLPNEGARLVSTDIRASITNTSVFMQKLHIDVNQELYHQFVAMNITQLPSGKYIIEKLHPIPKTAAIDQYPIQIITKIEAVSPEVSQEIQRDLNSYRAEPWGKWTVYQYDRPSCSCNVWGLATDKSMVEQTVQSVKEKTLKKHLNYYELLECGPISGNFRSGLECTHINHITSSLQLRLKRIPCKTVNELKVWLKENFRIQWDDIQNYKADKKSEQLKNVSLIFKNENVFQQAMKNISSEYLISEENYTRRDRRGEKEIWGRELIVTTPFNITENNITDLFGSDVVIKCEKISKQNVESSLRLSNLPLDTDETSLRQCIQREKGPNPKRLFLGSDKNNVTAWANITFNNEEDRNKASLIYSFQLCQNSFPIVIPGKRGQKQKFVTTKVENVDATNDETKTLPKNKYRVIANTRQSALRIFTKQWDSSVLHQNMDASEWKVDGSATATVYHIDLYPDVQTNIHSICNKFSVQVKTKDIPNNGKRFTFTDGSPQKTSLAAAMVSQTFAPIHIQISTDRQKQLFAELDDTGKIQQWANRLGLKINKNRMKIEIRGPQIAQGQFMREIADYSNSFNQRFQEYELSSSIAAFFARQRAASTKLQEIAKRWVQESYVVTFNKRTSTITIFAKPTASLSHMNKCRSDIDTLLNNIEEGEDHEIRDSSDDDESGEDETIIDDNNQKDNENDDDDVDDLNNDICDILSSRINRRCVFCKATSSICMNFFRICGHSYCRCAVQALSQDIVFPLQCQYCETPIHVRDIRDIFSHDERLYMQVMKRSIQRYLENNATGDNRVFCPNDECNGLIKLNQGYQTCLTCGDDVCPQCQTINDDNHVGRTCQQAIDERKKREFLPQLFAAAKKFVEENWPQDTSMQPIARMDENPYLEKKYKSLTRFNEGVQKLGHSLPPDLSKGFFAYHGTSHLAFNAICQTGFDPKRRSGQVYGRGEYFGISATVSHGYSQRRGSQDGFSQMIIAFLLHGPQTTTHGTFCYVVDNPTDWTYAFNLPVLVVTYGPTAVGQPSPFPHTIADYVDNESPWRAPFRWHWRQDNGQFEPYNDSINTILERSYEQWKLNNGPPRVVTPPLTRYIDDIPQIYEIDYENNKQTNKKTSYTRSIRRQETEKLLDSQNWYYRNEQNLWVRYESLIQDTIEQAFKLYKSGGGPSRIDVKFPGRPETYEIDFINGLQTNKNTNTQRGVKRD